MQTGGGRGVGLHLPPPARSLHWTLHKFINMRRALSKPDRRNWAVSLAHGGSSCLAWRLARRGSARLGLARLGPARHGSARPGSARLGSAWLGPARLGSARLGPARLGSARLSSARLGSARLSLARLADGVRLEIVLFWAVSVSGVLGTVTRRAAAPVACAGQRSGCLSRAAEGILFAESASLPNADVAVFSRGHGCPVNPNHSLSLYLSS